MRRWLRSRRADRPLSCRQVGQLLQSYLDGAVDDLTTRRVARHIEDCRRCGLEAETYLAIKASLARRDTQLPADALSRLRDFGQQLAAGGPHDLAADAVAAQDLDPEDMADADLAADQADHDDPDEPDEPTGS